MKAVMLAALDAVATVAFGEVVETSMVDVTRRSVWAQKQAIPAGLSVDISCPRAWRANQAQ